MALLYVQPFNLSVPCGSVTCSTFLSPVALLHAQPFCPLWLCYMLNLSVPCGSVTCSTFLSPVALLHAQPFCPLWLCYMLNLSVPCGSVTCSTFLSPVALLPACSQSLSRLHNYVPPFLQRRTGLCGDCVCVLTLSQEECSQGSVGTVSVC